MLAPIYESLIAYAQENNLRLHMPGHGGQAFSLPREWREIADFDVTEVAGIDDLHLPVGAIDEAQKLWAEAIKAKSSLFLVNGASSGVQALFLSLATKGKKVIIPRNAHRSFFAGLVLSGLDPVYIDLILEPATGIALGVTTEALKLALETNDDMAGVILTSPSYYGTTIDIIAMAELCKEYDIPLYIDEAHGSHFPFHDAYPTPALWQGAAAVVNGLHKSLPVFNQGASLNIAATCENEGALGQAASLITTTSPSFPLLASIDLARALMVESGYNLLEKALHLAQEFKSKINGIKGLRSLEAELKEINGVKAIDPLKVLISVAGLNINGYELADILRRDFNIQVELAEERLILAMFSIFHKGADWEKLYYALQEIAIRYNGNIVKDKKAIIPPPPQIILAPRSAYFSKKQTVRIEDSVGRLAGEMVAAYPPGIPCLLPGELITPAILDYLLYLRDSNIRIQGVKDNNLRSIEVII